MDKSGPEIKAHLKKNVTVLFEESGWFPPEAFFDWPAPGVLLFLRSSSAIIIIILFNSSAAIYKLEMLFFLVCEFILKKV